MAEHRAIYKCRLCGEEFVSATTGSADIAIKQMVRVTTGIKLLEFIGNPIEETYMHSCKDGSMGLADFFEFRKLEDGNEPDRKMEKP